MADVVTLTNSLNVVNSAPVDLLKARFVATVFVSVVTVAALDFCSAYRESESSLAVTDAKSISTVAELVFDTFCATNAELKFVVVIVPRSTELF